MIFDGQCLVSDLWEVWIGFAKNMEQDKEAHSHHFYSM